MTLRAGITALARDWLATQHDTEVEVWGFHVRAGSNARRAFRREKHAFAPWPSDPHLADDEQGNSSKNCQLTAQGK
jgi:hypothetical protein